MRSSIFFAFLWLILGMAPTKGSLDNRLLNIADQAAHWILSREVDQDPKSACWPSRENLPIEEKCDLYYGNAGILVFLRELYRATGKKEYADAMQRDVAFLDQNLAQIKLYGLYDGLAGIAFSAAQDSEDLRASTVCSRAVDYLVQGANKQANGGVRWNDDNDIMSGSAGIGLTLLKLGRQQARPELINLAVQAGTDLLARTVSAGLGHYWLHQLGAKKQYPNFAHGTAGIAYFLLKLYEQTGETRFRDGAIEGGKYLSSISSSKPATRCLVPHDLPEQNDLFYLGWCHGPAGTDRFFYELFAVTNDSQWKTFANAAADSVLHSGIPEKQTPGYWNNLSRCCGAVAVGEFFLARYRLDKALTDRLSRFE